ncbi:putative ribonuclease H-like domain-containing protein, partial [Tanacetum coccineum]
KFEGKSDEGFLVGYSLNSKAFRVYNLDTKRVEENMHITFLENKPNVAGKGPNWMFDLDYLTNLMNYQPVRSENQANKTAGLKEANHSAGTQDNNDARNSEMEAEFAQDCFVLPIWSSSTSTVKSSKAKNEGEKPNKNTGLKTNDKPVDKEDQAFLEEFKRLKRQEKEANDAAEALRKDTASPSGGLYYSDLNNSDQDDSQIPTLEDIYDNPSDGIFTNASYDDEGAVTDFTKYPKSVVQTRSKVHKSSGAHAFKIYEALEDESWVDAMREEQLQFKIQKVWVLIDFPYGKKEIRTKWVYRNKKDERGFVDPKFPKKVYKVVKALYGLHQTPKAWYATLLTFLLKSGYRRGTIDMTLFIKKDKNDIMSVKTACTPIETHKPLVKDEEAADVDVHLYRSMIGSLMYLTASRPDILYLKGKPKLDLWYPRESSFDLVAYSDNDYGGANLDRKSTTGGCQFLGHRDAYEKKLIQVLKIHTDNNVADLLTKAFDVIRHEELASPEQMASGLTATGKESSNPLMADSLPKTIQSNDPPLSRGYTLGSGEDSLKLIELMEFVQNCVTW